jgi:hypothetical protein
LRSLITYIRTNSVIIGYKLVPFLYYLGWTGSSSETWEMARFFAPASIWINLAMNKEDNQPPEKILSHVQYLESAITSKDMTSDGLLVVMANSCKL